MLPGARAWAHAVGAATTFWPSFGRSPAGELTAEIAAEEVLVSTRFSKTLTAPAVRSR